MASISYDDVFSVFMGSVTDYKLTSLEESDAYAIMAEHLHSAISETYVRRLFSSIAYDDATQTITYNIKLSIDEKADEDFVISALAKWMVYYWLHNQVRSVTHTAQFFGGKETRYYSQANHLAELRGLMDDAYREARMFVMDRGFIRNSYFGGAQ